MEPRRPPIAGVLRGHRLTDALSWQTENFLFHLLRWWWQGGCSLILPILCLRSSGTPCSALFNSFIFPKICVNWCAHCPSSQCALCTSGLIKACHQGGAAFYTIFHCALDPKVARNFSLQGQKKKSVRRSVTRLWAEKRLVEFLLAAWMPPSPSPRSDLGS